MMQHPLITLTTDFGVTDHFVGTMKGVILRIAPSVQIVDITHEVAPFEVAEGGFAIAQAYRFFAPATIHVIVVDPGVGSTRRPLLAEMGGQYFVAPDNGVLSMIFAREQPVVRHITNDRYFLHPVSRTFHGRDVFSPVAAHLASGVSVEAFGDMVEDFARLPSDKPNRTGKRTWTGVILKTDRFGNLITNLHIDDFPHLRERPFELNVGVETVRHFQDTFASAGPGEVFTIVGSSGFLEVAVNQGSASQTLGCKAGSPVELVLG